MAGSKELAAQMMQIIEQLFFIEKNNTIFYGKELKLYPSEIHLLLLINNGHISNATEMANKLRVTKGAVSQTISRLVKKGILEKRKDSHKKNELTVFFTPMGKKVLQKSSELRDLFHNIFVSHFLSLTKSEQLVISRFLSYLEELLNARVNNLKNE